MYCIRDTSCRYFVGDKLMWSGNFYDARFFLDGQAAFQYIQQVLPDMDLAQFQVYKIRYLIRSDGPGFKLVFSPFKPVV